MIDPDSPVTTDPAMQTAYLDWLRQYHDRPEDNRFGRYNTMQEAFFAGYMAAADILWPQPSAATPDADRSRPDRSRPDRSHWGRSRWDRAPG